MDKWTIGWLLWIGWFAIEEGLALWKGGPGSTLSEHICAWFGIPWAQQRVQAHRYDTTAAAKIPPPADGWIRLRRFLLIAGLAWLSLHFLSGGEF